MGFGREGEEGTVGWRGPPLRAGLRRRSVLLAGFGARAVKGRQIVTEIAGGIAVCFVVCFSNTAVVVARSLGPMW